MSAVIRIMKDSVTLRHFQISSASSTVRRSLARSSASVIGLPTAYHASDGHISFRGEDITREAPHTAAKRGIARTFQHNELFPQLTTLENLLLGRHAALDHDLISAGLFLKRCRRWGLEQREKIETVIEFFELEPYRKQPVGDLPYGVQKIIGLARAFAAEPR